MSNDSKRVDGCFRIYIKYNGFRYVQARRASFSIYPMFTEYGVLSEKFLNAEVKIVESRAANITNVYIELEDFNDVKD